MFGVRMAMKKLREHNLRHIGLAVAHHDEAHNRNLFSSGYLVAQRHLETSDIIPPLIFHRQPQKDLKEKVVAWARHYKLQAIGIASTKQPGA
ncbi:MAG: hypothetical protein ACI92G_000254 [Candidatus Pelagisphaera sp.]|jgi:hypothetical protein